MSPCNYESFPPPIEALTTAVMEEKSISTPDKQSDVAAETFSSSSSDEEEESSSEAKKAKKPTKAENKKKTRRRRRRGSSETQFPGKLHDLLSWVHGQRLTHIISWICNGHAFMIYDPSRLTEILPMFFGQTLYRSFRRQLNMWHFLRLQSGPHQGAFVHPLFLQGRKPLCQYMSRHVNPNELSELCEPVPLPSLPIQMGSVQIDPTSNTRRFQDYQNNTDSIFLNHRIGHNSSPPRMRQSEDGKSDLVISATRLTTAQKPKLGSGSRKGKVENIVSPNAGGDLMMKTINEGRATPLQAGVIQRSNDSSAATFADLSNNTLFPPERALQNPDTTSSPTSLLGSTDEDIALFGLGSPASPEGIEKIFKEGF